MTWRVWIDVGGTFTDCIAIDPDGAAHRSKVLSSGVVRCNAQLGGRRVRLDDASLHGLCAGAELRVGGRSFEVKRVEDGALVLDDDAGSGRLLVELSTGEPAPVLAARLATVTPANRPLPDIAMRLATTRATNALLERAFKPPALFITSGFTDLLRIGNQQRPDIFAIDIRKPPPVTDHVFAVPGRIGPGDNEAEPFDDAACERAARAAVEAGCESAAIALINSWLDPSHEVRLEQILRTVGFRTVVRSSALSPRIGLLHRAQTAATEAALAPVISDYVECVRTSGVGRLQALTSAGGVADASSFHAVDSLLSGPAGGVMGALASAKRAGVSRVLSFDMGGTSSDVARIDGAPDLTPTHRVADVTVARPAVSIETVAAGGGSICDFVDGRPTVGPRSAGADPGPACYGRGGPLTLTDVNVLLGRIDPAHFEIPVSLDDANRALDRLIEVSGTPLGREELLAGFVDLAEETMAEAIRHVTIRRGYDPSDHALVAFGGAGPQHACGIAERLSIDTVLVPPDASLLSALGVGSAPVERFAERQILRTLEACEDDVPRVIKALSREAVDALSASDTLESEPGTRAVVSLRLVGQDTPIEIDADPWESLRARFAERYADFHGYQPDRPIEVVGLRVTATSEPRPVDESSSNDGAAEEAGSKRVHDGETLRDVPVLKRAHLRIDPVDGPALIGERHTTTWLPPAWTASVDDSGTIIARRTAKRRTTVAHAKPLRRELIVTRLSGIAGAMGETLRSAAVSVNVKERADYSCGVLDPSGRLVASAPHMPVHLGALGLCVRRVIETLGALAPGDVAVTNHPAYGGSHLPDITTVQPAYTSDGRLLGYVASRAHHAEIGGSAPGSMPPDAHTLAEEGAAIAPMFLIRDGETRWDEIRAILTGGPWPTRALGDNLADLEAAIAAGHRAADDLARIAHNEGTDDVLDAMGWIIAHSDQLVRDAVSRIDGLPVEGEACLDDGSVIHARLDRDENGLVMDFAGTSGTHPTNLNAPLVVTRSAVSYVLRLLLDRDVPLNDGLLAPVAVRVPEDTLLNPSFSDDPATSPAVAGGNVEISQRVTNLLVRMLRLAASSQGTMNNLLLGNDSFGYYETICGGSGASHHADGADAVHTHMTNTAITDPEVIEHRYPLTLRRFEIRPESGGPGEHRGGSGAIREFEARDSIRLSIITQHRTDGPPGLDGGGAGATGSQRVERANGTTDVLAPSDSTTLNPGDRVVIETPGGGGCG